MNDSPSISSHYIFYCLLRPLQRCRRALGADHFVRCVERQKQLLSMHARATGQWRYKRYFNGVARNMKPLLVASTCFLVLCASVAQAGSNRLSVTEYHGGPDRSGHYVVPG